MTREEEIKNSAPFADWVQQGEKERNVDVGFFQGARWADKHPSDETIEKVINLSRRWSIANEGTRTDYIKKHWNDEH